MSAALTEIDGIPYIDAIRASALFVDATYQRDLDEKRIAKMAPNFDRRLLGVLDVSARGDGRFAVIDGQHRHALVLAVADSGEDPLLVCQVHEGLTVEDESRLFHDINLGRKALSWWDRWRARRGAGDELVLDIERILTAHGCRVHPAQQDGNIRATKALENIASDYGRADLLDAVLHVAIEAFGRSVDAMDGAVLQGIALVLTSYRPDELDRERLIDRLVNTQPRMIRAKAAALREEHKGTLPRLCATVIIERYNRRGSGGVQPFLSRVLTGRPVAASAPSCACTHSRDDHVELAPQCAAPSCTCLRYRPAVAQ